MQAQCSVGTVHYRHSAGGPRAPAGRVGSGLPPAVPHLHQAACHPGGEVLLEVDGDPVARQDVDTGDLPEDLKK
jgi:hypothetical protein